MEVHNKVNPSEQQMAEFMEPGHDEPIYMLNLLKLRRRPLMRIIAKRH